MAGCLPSDSVPSEKLSHGQKEKLSVRFGQKPCQDVTIQQRAPEIQPQHRCPRGQFFPPEGDAPASHQCDSFCFLSSVPWNSCSGIYFTAPPDGSTASCRLHHSTSHSLSAISDCWGGQLVSSCPPETLSAWLPSEVTGSYPC